MRRLTRELILSNMSSPEPAVEYVAMRAWRDPDAWPETDLVLMQAIAGRDPSMVRALHQRARTQTWRPWRACAAMHLWNEFADQLGVARGG